ncbi:hypothetical protein KQI82_09115 [Oscillibacter sp. MSJ-2]|uniref:Uncharacterized protein n=1 Tax=Dysosmobacter acutus TaxID=2841504 RepID=A0ABS6FAJ0_9FIRM|nr:hypothetical protein [Dysosmobacter acutus]
MAEFEDKLNALLNDPSSMAQIMQLAQSFSAQNGNSAAPPPPPPPAPAAAAPPPAADPSPLSGLLGGLDPNLIGKLLPLLQNTGGNSESAQLLYALRPFLKPERQDKVDRALQLARMIHLAKQFFTNWEA